MKAMITRLISGERAEQLLSGRRCNQHDPDRLLTRVSGVVKQVLIVDLAHASYPVLLTFRSPSKKRFKFCHRSTAPNVVHQTIDGAPASFGPLLKTDGITLSLIMSSMMTFRYNMPSYMIVCKASAGWSRGAPSTFCL